MRELKISFNILIDDARTIKDVKKRLKITFYGRKIESTIKVKEFVNRL